MSLARQLDFVENAVREHLMLTSVVRVSQDTGLGQANLFRLVKGGGMKVDTLRTLATYFDDHPDALPPLPRPSKPAAAKPETNAPWSNCDV